MPILMVALGASVVLAGIWLSRQRFKRMRAILTPLCSRYGGRIQQPLGDVPRLVFERDGAQVVFTATAADPDSPDVTARRGQSLVQIESDRLPDLWFRVETRDFLEEDSRPAGHEPPPPGSAEFRRRFRCEGDSHEMLRAVLTPARQVRLLQLHDRRRAVMATVRERAAANPAVAPVRYLDMMVQDELTDLIEIQELMDLALELHDALIASMRAVA